MKAQMTAMRMMRWVVVWGWRWGSAWPAGSGPAGQEWVGEGGGGGGGGGG